MREQIAMWLHSKQRGVLKVTFEASPINVSWEELEEARREAFRAQAKHLLSMQAEEIKKVENPYVTEGRHWQIQIKAFEDCRQKILKALKSE